MSDAMEVMLTRRAVRKYKTEQVPDDLLNQVLTAGTYAPTAMGKQKVRIVAIQNQDDRNEVSRLNAAAMNSSGDPYYGAPMIVVVFAEADNTRGDLDGSAVCMNMLNAAHAVGLASCWINRSKEVFATEDGKALLRKWGLPDDLVGVASFSLGFADGEYPTPIARRPDYCTIVR
ncbi:MAG: nitroreductase [Oscillospiraceae bacterium]|nr:nitroreductase [Oscillospiraceae bacterium]